MQNAKANLDKAQAAYNTAKQASDAAHAQAVGDGERLPHERAAALRDGGVHAVGLDVEEHAVQGVARAVAGERQVGGNAALDLIDVLVDGGLVEVVVLEGRAELLRQRR